MTSPVKMSLSPEQIARALASACPLQGMPACQGKLTQAAVLIPLIRRAESWEVLFTRRTDSVENHKGQVAFPGGAVEEQDHTPEETALREAWEEIGLPPESVQVLGRLPRLSTITGYCVTPVVGEIVQPVTFHPAPAEVSRVFQVPLVWLADHRNWEWRWYTRLNGTADWVIFYQPYEGETIWGVTAMILHSFLCAIGWMNPAPPPVNHS